MGAGTTGPGCHVFMRSLGHRNGTHQESVEGLC